MVMVSEDLADSVEDSRGDLMRGISVIFFLHFLVEDSRDNLVDENELISVKISRCDYGSLSKMLYSE
jgi:hypothetical protein